ncbi:MAG: hypothetical protein M0R32_10410 [Candidatus Cloacimonetes bacterium]|nr:hypothetical protein [Candidatus Cloacimonadota bacterium]
MSWYKESKLKKQCGTIMYHNTSAENDFLIARGGLKINQEWGKTIGAQSDIEKIYGMRPVFLSLTPERFKGSRDITLAIEVSGLELVADIPSLYDKGGYYDDNGMWWEEEGVPLPLLDYVDEDGYIPYDFMLDPNAPVCKACIALTGTAACLESIAPERITILK